MIFFFLIITFITFINNIKQNLNVLNSFLKKNYNFTNFEFITMEF